MGLKNFFTLLFQEATPVVQKDPQVSLSDFDIKLLCFQYPTLKTVILKYVELEQYDSLIEFLFGLELSDSHQNNH